MKTKSIIEWAPFTLKEGITPAQLAEASLHLQNEFLSKQAGFVRRELLKQSDRNYVDLVYWESNESAQSAMQNVMNSTVCLAYFQLMEEADHDHPEMGVQHLEVAHVYA